MLSCRNLWKGFNPTLTLMFSLCRKNQTRQEILSELRKFDVRTTTHPTPKAVKLTNSHYKDLHKHDLQIKHKKENT